MILSLLLVLAAQQAKGPIEWSKGIEDAKKAAGGKKPIAIFLSQKTCALSAEFLKNLEKDERLPELAGGFAWLSVQVGTPEYRTWYLKTCGGAVAGTPALLFLDPKGDNANPDYAGLPPVSSTDPDDIIPVLRGVLQRAKQPVSEKDKAKVKESMEKAAKAAAAGDAIAAWKLAIRAGDGWRTEEKAVADARAGIAKKLQEGAAEMLRIQSSERDPKAQLEAFEKVKGGWAGTSIADWAVDEIARVKKSASK